MIIYIENPIDCIKKDTIISDDRQVVGYKISKQK